MKNTTNTTPAADAAEKAAGTKPAKEAKPKELKHFVFNQPGQPVEMVISEDEIKTVPEGWVEIFSGTHAECAKFAGR